MSTLPQVVADGPLAPAVLDPLLGKVELLPWALTASGTHNDVVGLYTYGHPAVDDAVLSRFPNLKVISNYGVGVDHIDLTAAAARNIPVGNTPGILDGATADMAFALLLAAARRIVEGDKFARSPEFTSYDPGYMLGREVHGQILGIIGMGRIGRQIAKRAKGFDMRVLYNNRNRDLQAEEEMGVEFDPFYELLQRADFVVLSVPLNDETRNLIDHFAFSMMKPSAILINISRGPVVNTDELLAALQSGAIAGAAVDVTDPEPLPRDHPLLKMDNLVIAPHLGSATIQTRQRMAEMSVENLLAGLDGQPLPNSVS